MRKIIPGNLRLLMARRPLVARRPPLAPTPVPPPPPLPAMVRDPAGDVPYALRVAAALSWRLIVVAGALAIIGWLVVQLSLVVIPVAVALLLAAMLAPAVDSLCDRGVPRGLSSAVVLVGGLAVVGSVLTFVVRAFIAGLPDLQREVGESINTIRDWLTGPPLNMSAGDLNDALDSIAKAATENREQITSGALTTVTGVGHFVTGALLALFTLIFFLYDGRPIWKFVVRVVPRPIRARADLAGQRSFASLVAYVRASVLVAVVDAVGIGLGLWIMQVPLFVPLSALVFLSAFVPIVGAVVAGVVAVLVALVTKGFVTALIVLAIVIAVQQVEGHVLQPILMGRAVALHPLAVVLAVAGGVVAAGIVGALLAVPLVAVLNAGLRSLASDQELGIRPAAVDATDPDEAAPPGEGAGEEPGRAGTDSGPVGGPRADTRDQPI